MDSTANVPQIDARIATAPWAPNQAAPALQNVQAQWTDYILDRNDANKSPALRDTSPQRLGTYHHTYRARLSEVPADSFAKTVLYMGTRTFDEQAQASAVQMLPRTRSLGRYGDVFPDYLAQEHNWLCKAQPCYPA